MQVSATLIAAQAAAREARARLQMPQAQAGSGAGFAAALDKAGSSPAGFQALPLRQTSADARPAQAPGRMGQHIDILI